MFRIMNDDFRPQTRLELHVYNLKSVSYLVSQSMVDWFIVQCFQQYFSYIAAASAPSHAFLEFF